MRENDDHEMIHRREAEKERITQRSLRVFYFEAFERSALKASVIKRSLRDKRTELIQVNLSTAFATGVMSPRRTAGDKRA